MNKKILYNIGLEIHCELLSESKLFSDCSIEMSAVHNTEIDEYTLGFPGTLPVANKKSVEMAVKMALALNANINKESFFDRKHYYYYDLPKGYQITQSRVPLAQDGYVNLPNGKQINIQRIHIEEDAGKSIINNNEILVDYNRAGIPLIEIVTLPDIDTPEDAALFLKEIRNIALGCGVNNGNLQNGELRCDANVSVRFENESHGIKVEIKNLNSYKFLKSAIEYEITRQKEMIVSGKAIQSETRGFDEHHSKTYLMRIKDDTSDYRFLPEPDLAPLVVDEVMIKSIKNSLPELPEKLRTIYKNKMQLDVSQIDLLLNDKFLNDYYFGFVDKYLKDLKLFNTLYFNELRNYYLKKNVLPEPEKFIQIVNLISDNIVPKTKFTELLSYKFINRESPEAIAQKYNLTVMEDTDEIIACIIKVLEVNKDKTEEYLKGNLKLFGLLVGECIRQTDNRASPEILKKHLSAILNSYAIK